MRARRSASRSSPPSAPRLAVPSATILPWSRSTIRSAYCAARVRSCIAATRVSPGLVAQLRRAARAPAVDARCRGQQSARRGSRFQPPARERARRPPAAARPRSRFREFALRKLEQVEARKRSLPAASRSIVDLRGRGHQGTGYARAERIRRRSARPVCLGSCGTTATLLRAALCVSEFAASDVVQPTLPS